MKLSYAKTKIILRENWLSAQMREQAWAKYEKVRKQALVEYEKVRGLAWAEYEKVSGQALAEYKKSCKRD